MEIEPQSVAFAEALERCRSYFVYMLHSQRPRSHRTYVGFTVDPPRRLRQHNGEITAGAWKTKQGRPWEMQCFVLGFPNKTVALQFEWQWQHPLESRVVRDHLDAAASSKTRGLKYRLAVLKALMTCPLWQQLQLVIVPLTATAAQLLQRLPLPHRSVTATADLNLVSDELRKRRTVRNVGASSGARRRLCHICQTTSAESRTWQCNGCASATHVVCLAKYSNPSASTILPAEGRCPACGAVYPWCRVVAQVQPLADEEDDGDGLGVDFGAQEGDEEDEDDEGEGDYDEEDAEEEGNDDDDDDDDDDGDYDDGAGDLSQQNCFGAADEGEVVDLTQL